MRWRRKGKGEQEESGESWVVTLVMRLVDIVKTSVVKV